MRSTMPTNIIFASFDVLEKVNMNDELKGQSIATMQRTGEKIKFLDVHIGNPFYAHSKVWVRTTYQAAAELGDSGERKSVCNFTIDECDKLVERIKIIK